MGNKLIEGCNKPEGKEMMTRFFQIANYLEDNIETITLQEFRIKSDEMWRTLRKVEEIEGCYFMIDLFSLGDKADKRFGNPPVEKPNKGFFSKLFEYFKS